RLIELAAEGRRGSAPGLAPELNALLDGPSRPWVRLFAALGELVPQECLPVLLVVPAAGGPQATPLAELARLLAELAAAGRRAALVLIVEPGRFEAGLAPAPDTRAKALLREGLIPVAEPGRDHPSSLPESADHTPHPDISPAAGTPQSDPEARSAV